VTTRSMHDGETRGYDLSHRALTAATLEPARLRQAPGRAGEALAPLGSGPLVGVLCQSAALVLPRGHQGGRCRVRPLAELPARNQSTVGRTRPGLDGVGRQAGV